MAGKHLPKTAPTLQEEIALWEQGYRAVAGIDEVGRGPLAGPVVAAAVIASSGANPPWLQEVRDSKVLRPRQREVLCPRIKEWAVASGVGMADAQTIDSIGILAATRLAMGRAVAQLPSPPDFLLIDGLRLPALPCSQKRVIDGDALCLSIAAASIVAKVFRDNLMAQMEQEYPGYGFARHKGYGTREHQSALARLGPCPIHRHSFAPVSRLPEL